MESGSMTVHDILQNKIDFKCSTLKKRIVFLFHPKPTINPGSFLIPPSKAHQSRIILPTFRTRWSL